MKYHPLRCDYCNKVPRGKARIAERQNTPLFALITASSGRKLGMQNDTLPSWRRVMKRRNLRGKALLNSLAQSLVNFWGDDYVYSLVYRNGSKEFRSACLYAYVYTS